MVSKFLSACLIGILCVQAAGDDLTEQLLPIVVKIKANRGRIITWEGSVKIADVLLYEGKERLASYEADYTLDRTIETLRWSFKELPDGHVRSVVTEEKDAVSSTPVALNSVTGILRNDGLSRIDTRIVGMSADVLDIQPTNLFTRSYTSWDFDPMYYFDPAASSAASAIQLVYDMRDNQFSTWKVSKSGSLVKVRSEVNIGINEYVVDLNSGSNIVQTLMTERDYSGNLRGESTWNATFVQVGDIWVPNRVSYEDKDYVNKTNYSRLLEWKSQTVNGTLAEQSFDLAAIGVGNGFTVVDNRTGSLMDVKDGKMIPRVERGIEGPPNPRRYSIWIATILVLLGLFGIYFLSRRSAPNTTSQ